MKTSSETSEQTSEEVNPETPGRRKTAEQGSLGFQAVVLETRHSRAFSEAITNQEGGSPKLFFVTLDTHPRLELISAQKDLKAMLCPSTSRSTGRSLWLAPCPGPAA